MAQHILSGIEEVLGTIYGSVEHILSGIEEVLGTIYGSSRAYSFWH